MNLRAVLATSIIRDGHSSFLAIPPHFCSDLTSNRTAEFRDFFYVGYDR